MGVFKILLNVWHLPVFKRVILFVASLVPDKLYVKMIFRGKLGYKPNLDNPQTFNEKLNWIKLYKRNPLYTQMADKYAVKKIVAERIGEQYVVKNLGVWSRFDDIDFSKLPTAFVLKCTHDSSGATIFRGGVNPADLKAAKKKIENSQKLNDLGFVSA